MVVQQAAEPWVAERPAVELLEVEPRVAVEPQVVAPQAAGPWAARLAVEAVRVDSLPAVALVKAAAKVEPVARVARMVRRLVVAAVR